MTGNAIMYDAVAVKVLTVGGSPDYQQSYATTTAYIATLGNPNPTQQETINLMYCSSP